MVVINKCDLLTAVEMAELHQAILEQYPRAQRFEVSTRHGSGLEAWFEQITATTQGLRSTMELDYAVYAEGEAALGWLNAMVRVSSEMAFDGNQMLQLLGQANDKQLRKLEQMTRSMESHQTTLTDF